MARRESMIVYASWLDAIKELPAAVKAETQNAILEYGIEGTMPADIGQTTKAVMALIRPQIDANNAKYENGCKGGEYGVLGGRPRKPQENPKETPRKPQENPKETPIMIYDNVNDNDNVNVNDNERECATHATRTREEEIFNNFISWCEVFAADSLKFIEPLNLSGFTWLYNKYGGERVKQCASDLHNKGAYKRNKNALNCWKRWIEKL